MGGYEPNGIVNLYLFSLCTVGLNFYFIYNLAKRQGAASVSGWLSALHLAATLAFVFLDINVGLIPVDSASGRKAIRTVQYLVDAVSLVSLGLAFFLDMRKWLTAFHLPGWARLGLWLPLLPIVVYPVCDVLGIVALWDSGLRGAADGQFVTIVFGVWSVLFAANELLVHLLLCLAVYRCYALASVKLGLAYAAVLASPLALLMGAIWRIVNPQIGITVFYAAWLASCLVFLWQQRVVRHVKVSREATRTHPTTPVSAVNEIDSVKPSVAQDREV